jgi:hypothetical protein
LTAVVVGGGLRTVDAKHPLVVQHRVHDTVISVNKQRLATYIF